MLEITGAHNTAKAFIDTIDEQAARAQITHHVPTRTFWRTAASG